MQIVSIADNAVLCERTVNNCIRFAHNLKSAVHSMTVSVSRSLLSIYHFRIFAIFCTIHTKSKCLELIDSPARFVRCYPFGASKSPNSYRHIRIQRPAQKENMIENALVEQMNVGVSSSIMYYLFDFIFPLFVRQYT